MNLKLIAPDTQVHKRANVIRNALIDTKNKVQYIFFGS